MSDLDVVDVKLHLNITNSTNDDELEVMLDAAEAAIGNIVGPLEPTTVTEQLYGTVNGQLVLSKAPVLSVTSITPYGGTAMDLSGVFVRYGIVSYVANVPFFVNPFAPFVVVYECGRTTLPADLALAVLEMVRHLWATQRGGGATRPGSAASSEIGNTVPGAAYALPIRVEQLLAPYVMPGLA